MLLRSRLLRAVSLSLILLAPALLPAQETPLHTATQQELDVVKVLLKQQEAWNRGDIDSFVQGYKDSPDILFIARQISRGYAGMVEAYKRDYPTRAAMGALAFSELEVHPLGENFAAVVGKYHLERAKKEGGDADGIFSLVLEKTDKGWKIVIDHTT